MSSKPAKAEAKPEEDAAAPKNKGKRTLIMIIAAVVLLALIGGGAALFLTKKKAAASEDGEDDAEPQKTSAKAEHGKPPVFVQLDAFTVNLQAENGDQFLQVVLNFKVSTNEQGEEVKQYMPELRHQILMLLSSKKASEISTVDGREALATEIRDKANSVLGYDESAPKKKKKGKKADEEPSGPIQAVLFTSFIIQ